MQMDKNCHKQILWGRQHLVGGLRIQKKQVEIKKKLGQAQPEAWDIN